MTVCKKLEVLWLVLWPVGLVGALSLSCFQFCLLSSSYKSTRFLETWKGLLKTLAVRCRVVMVELQFKLWIRQIAAQSHCILQTHPKRNQWDDLRLFLSDLTEKKGKMLVLACVLF